MTDKVHDRELAELKADIMSLREQIAALAAGLSAPARAKPADTHSETPPESAQEDTAGDEGTTYGTWEELLHKFTSSKAQGEKVVRGLAAEVEHHPLVSIMAAFGLGYIIAKLWYEEGKQ